MKFKGVIIVVLMMLICAMGMLVYIVANDSVKVSGVPVIGNLIENVSSEIKNTEQQLGKRKK